MLVLSRKVKESFWIGEDIEVTVVRIGSAVRLAIKAPKGVNVVRTELLDKPANEQEGLRREA